MRVFAVSVAVAMADESCVDDTVLLQVKTQKNPPMYPAAGGPPMYPPAGGVPPTDFYPPAGGDYSMPGMYPPAGGDYSVPPTDSYPPADGTMPPTDFYPPAGDYTEYPPADALPTDYANTPPVDHIPDPMAQSVADEFNLPVDAVESFMDQYFPQFFEEFGLADGPFIEELVQDFCIENGGINCHELAVKAVDHVIEQLHHMEHEDHADEHPKLTPCEEQAIWPLWHCDDHECWEGEDVMHLDEVHYCEHKSHCEEGDWQCEDQAWMMTEPICQYPAFKELWGEHPSGIPTVQQVPDGPPDHVCMLEHDCIHMTGGWEAIEMHGWEEVDACVCDKFHPEIINRSPDESWHVGYFTDYCAHNDHHMPDMYYPAGTGADFYNLMAKTANKGKKFLQRSGMSRRVNVKQLVKAKFLKALKEKLN